MNLNEKDKKLPGRISALRKTIEFLTIIIIFFVIFVATIPHSLIIKYVLFLIFGLAMMSRAYRWNKIEKSVEFEVNIPKAKIDKGFCLSYYDLTYRRKFIRTLWIGLIFLPFLIYIFNSKMQLFYIYLILFFIQLGYNYLQMKNEVADQDLDDSKNNKKEKL